MGRKWGMLVLLCILTAFAVVQNTSDKGAGAAASAAAEAKPKKGFAAPSFELTDLQEASVAFGGASDHITLINFWASWCGPCVLEAPDLQLLHEKYSGRMLLLGVNATHYDREREARQFVEDYGFTFPVLMDRKGEVVDLYRVAQFPTTLLVDRDGIVRERITGVIPRVKWESLIEKYL